MNGLFGKHLAILSVMHYFNKLLGEAQLCRTGSLSLDAFALGSRHWFRGADWVCVQ